MSKVDPSDKRMFPKFSAAEIDRLCRFGHQQRYSKGQPLFVTGEIAPGMFVLKSGRAQVTRRDPLGHLAPIVEETAGDFVAEVGQLSGRPALVDVHAVEDIEAVVIRAENLRSVMIAAGRPTSGCGQRHHGRRTAASASDRLSLCRDRDTTNFHRGERCR